ncbi:MAG: MSMEG_4193 family putative phosphomutase [Actinomycetota bacterium]
MLLFLVRHALTPHTGDKLSGWMPGISLSDEGRSQVADLVERMKPVHLDAIYASPLERCIETARPVASSKGLRVRVRDGLGEVRYGDWEGKRLRTLAKTKLWKQVMARPSEARFPGGETIRETQFRAVSAIEGLNGEHPKQAVGVFTHADVIRVALAHYAGVPLDLYHRLVVAPVSVTVLWIGSGGPRVLKVNDTGSLDGFGQPKRRRG